MEDHQENNFKLVKRGEYKNPEVKKKLDQEDFNMSLIPNVNYLLILYDYCILGQLINNKLINVKVDSSKFLDENFSDQYIINSEYKRIRINETHNCDGIEPGECNVKIWGWVPTYKTVYVTYRDKIYEKGRFHTNTFYLKNPYYDNSITLTDLINKYTNNVEIELIYNQSQILEKIFDSCIKKKYFKDSIKEFSNKIKSLNKSN